MLLILTSKEVLQFVYVIYTCRVFDRKIAIITGAATGIGKACALRLAKEGFSLVLNYRSKKELVEKLLTEIEGDSHQIYQADLSNSQEIYALVDFAISKYKQIDLVVNAAGIFDEHDITKLEYQDWIDSWEYNIKVNLLAPVNLSFCAAQYMMKQGSGKIINITSRGAFRGEPEAPAYGASKSGLNSASQSLAQALAPYGVSVFAIAPGWVDTPLASKYLSSDIYKQSPLGRIGKPSEIANLVAFLAGAQTEYLTGAIFDANGASYLRN